MEDADRVKLEETIDQKSVFYSDPKRISIFLNNLLSNSIKYQTYSGDRKPRIDVRITTKEDKAIIIVEDNGIGIQEEYVSKIFNMFFRASEKSFGSGLGLYIVKQSVEKLGGSIQVESKLNRGTKFTVVLPNRQGE
jgi:signal transduction histidine kinase